MLALTGPHGPTGSLVVYVKVTDPAVISAALVVYIAVGVLLLKDPVPLVVHVAAVALPPIEPAIVAVLPEQIVCGIPAPTVAAASMATVVKVETGTLQPGADV